jgi:hypothetical protein
MWLRKPKGVKMSESDDNDTSKRDTTSAIAAVIVMSLVGYLVGHAFGYKEGEKYANRMIYKEAFIRGHGEWRPDRNGYKKWHWHKSPDQKEDNNGPR